MFPPNKLLFLNRTKQWEFIPATNVKIGSHITGGDKIGQVFENSLVTHKILLPPKARGTVTFIATPGSYTVDETVLEVEFDGEKHKYTMMQVRFFFMLVRLYIMHSILAPSEITVRLFKSDRFFFFFNGVRCCGKPSFEPPYVIYCLQYRTDVSRTRTHGPVFMSPVNLPFQILEMKNILSSSELFLVSTLHTDTFESRGPNISK